MFFEVLPKNKTDTTAANALVSVLISIFQGRMRSILLIVAAGRRFFVLQSGSNESAE